MALNKDGTSQREPGGGNYEGEKINAVLNWQDAVNAIEIRIRRDISSVSHGKPGREQGGDATSFRGNCRKSMGTGKKGK